MPACRVRIAAAIVTVGLMTASCGGGDGGPMQPPGVGSIDVTPAQATIEAGAQQQFATTVRDESGAVLTDRSVSWSASPSDVATVSNTGLATGVGEGVATISATAGGVTGTAQLTVELGVFSPAANTVLAGNRSFAEVNIPAGVTVTVTGDLNLTVAGPITINGDLVGDCVEMLIEGEGSIDLSGDIDNSCAAAPAGEAPGLTIIGDGELNIDGASMMSSGDVDIANSPGLPPANVPAAAFGEGPARQVPVGPYPCSIQNYTVVTGAVAANSGVDGVNGAPGFRGSGFAFACNGHLAWRGNVQVQTQDGGMGGMGLGAPTTTGGDGGQGGILLLRAFGDMVFTDQAPGNIPNQFFAGNGGNAGHSNSAIPAPDPVPNVAPGGMATGGTGGQGGAVRVEANTISWDPASFFARGGWGGIGGDAFAAGADGVDGDQRPGNAQIGGPATATGGPGGSAPGFIWVAFVDAIGVQNAVFDDAVPGGDGGTSDAVGGFGGNGEDGDLAAKAGAQGGMITSRGGDGGSAGSGRGGAGGFALFSDGWGGNGWVDCRAPPDMLGGGGGAGGDAVGGGGAGGPGLNPGADGDYITTDVSNGGDGGDGEPTVGPAGPPGNNGIAGYNPAAPNELGLGSFLPGAPGDPCKSGSYIFTMSLVEDLDNHAQFLGLPTFGTFDLVATPPAAGEQLGEVMITGPAPWPVLEGDWDPDTQEIWLFGSATLGGGNYPNVSFEFHGFLTCQNDFFGDLVLDNFPAPFVNPILFALFGFQATTPSPPSEAMLQEILRTRAPATCLEPPS